ncbi:hypothetical protein [Streptosporangium sp. V21-05]|uniref:hypothetical protein n=1 Tax=Streptosporangium sp. V21-05 TaxID=3446115 RepID=UPI003F5392E3
MAPSLAELAEPCRRCAHQRAVHTGGAQPGGWAPYDRIWANATGWCRYPGCDCPART